MNLVFNSLIPTLTSNNSNGWSVSVSTTATKVWYHNNDGEHSYNASNFYNEVINKRGSLYCNATDGTTITFQYTSDNEFDLYYVPALLATYHQYTIRNFDASAELYIDNVLVEKKEFIDIISQKVKFFLSKKHVKSIKIVAKFSNTTSQQYYYLYYNPIYGRNN